MRFAAIFALALVALAMLLGGCSSTPTLTKSEFQDSVKKARDRTDYALAQITQAKSRDDFVNRMETSADLIDDAADDFSNAGAAKGFEDEHDQLTEHFHQLGADLRGTAAQVKLPGYEDLLNAKGVSFKSWVQINATLAKLGKRGIAVEPLGRH